MNDDISKVVAGLQQNGVGIVRHELDNEFPDLVFLIGVWVSFEEKSLYLNYDWKKQIYYFYVWKSRKQVVMPKGSRFDRYKVSEYIKHKLGKLLPYARRIDHALDTKQIYFTTDPGKISLIHDCYDEFVALVSWLCKEANYDFFNAGIMTKGEKPYFVMGDYDLALNKLQRIGYHTIEISECDEEGKYLLDASFGGFDFDWSEINGSIMDYIRKELQNEFGDCIGDSVYLEQSKIWFYNLDLIDSESVHEVKKFIREWNQRKPYNIRCSMADMSKNDLSCLRTDYHFIQAGITLAFKNGFKYK